MYTITGASRVDFTAYAPMHAFKGWTVRDLTGHIEVDFENQTIKEFSAVASTLAFETADAERTQAMKDYFHFAKHPQASFQMTECRQFQRSGERGLQATVAGALELSGVRRLVPIVCAIQNKENDLHMQLRLKWSFNAYGLKAPRLLFLTVRDIVDIQGNLHFTQSH